MQPALLTGLILLPVLALTEQGLFAHISVFGARPTLLLLVVLDWSLLRGVEEGMLWGLLGGVVVDLFSGLPFGTSSLAFVGVAGLVGLGERWLHHAHVLLPAITAVLATVVYYIVAIIMTASFDHVLYLDSVMLRTILGVALFNAALNPLVYVGLRALDRRIHPIAKANW